MALSWQSCLAEPGGPSGVHDRTLSIVRDDATETLSGAIDGVLIGADEALAAVAVLRGPGDCRDFIAAVTPMTLRIGRMLNSIANIAATGLLALAAVSECVGAPIALPGYDVERRFVDFTVADPIPREEKVTGAFLSLVLGRLEDIGFFFPGRRPKSPDDPVTLVFALYDALRSPSARDDALAAWEAYLRAFPKAWQDDKTEWRQLVLAGRVVLAELGDTPVGEVADALHRRALELAAEEQARAPLA